MDALTVVWKWFGSHLYFDVALLVAVGTFVVLWASRPRPGLSSPLVRPRRVVASVFGSLVCGALLVLQFAQREAWLWLLAFVPTGMVLYQALAVAIFKNHQFFDDAQAAPRAMSSAQPFMQPLMNATWNEERRYYSTPSLALRFGIPALLLGAVTLMAGHCLLDDHFCRAQLPAFHTDAQRLRVFGAARLGLAGAYVWVVMYLGNRGFRADVTPGAAIWSALTIAVGPVFAAVLVYIANPALDDRWSAHIVPFAAGFSLRYTADVVEAAIRRIMGGAAQNAARSVPLSQIRGISKDVEQRLGEEGIENVEQLAMANPHRLRRNTCYDKRQIVAWIDQALLMTYLPLAWQSLEAEGITGAIDLVWYVDPKSAERSECQANCPITAPVTELATRNKVDPKALWEATLRLHSDQQVQLIWALYQFDDRETDGKESRLPTPLAAARENTNTTESSSVTSAPIRSDLPPLAGTSPAA